MALFFDYQWFDGRLAAHGLGRGDVAARLSLTGEQVDQLFKDQRELSAKDVLVLAEMLGEAAGEVADRAGRKSVGEGKRVVGERGGGWLRVLGVRKK